MLHFTRINTLRYSENCQQDSHLWAAHNWPLQSWLHYRGRLQCVSATLVLFGAGRLAVLERWLPYTVTIIDRFHCITCCIIHSTTSVVMCYCIPNEHTIIHTCNFGVVCTTVNEHRHFWPHILQDTIFTQI